MQETVGGLYDYNWDAVDTRWGWALSIKGYKGHYIKDIQ